MFRCCGLFGGGGRRGKGFLQRGEENKVVVKQSQSVSLCRASSVFPVRTVQYKYTRQGGAERESESVCVFAIQEVWHGTV